jgi:hypothetical protein
VFPGCAAVIGRRDLGLRGKFAGMRLVMLAVLAIGCGGHASSPAASSPPHGGAAFAGVAGFPATRWVPARPTYVFASATVSDAQRSLRDAIDVLGIASGVELRDVTSALQGLLGVDPLHPDPLAAIGVDPHGSWAMFSEALSPTLVVHLTAPAQVAAFFDHQRTRGLVTRSATVDKTEVVSAELFGRVTISWAIAGDWLWLHVAPASAHEDPASWFAANQGAHGDGWTGNWRWAQQAAGAAAGLIGFLDLHGPIAAALARLPDAVACAKLVEPVGRVAVAVGGDEHHVAARLAIDVGSTTAIRPLILPAPSGWNAAAAPAAIAVQWNLDLSAVRSWLAPCLAAVGGPRALPDEPAVRAGRGMLLGFDPDARSGSGAVALDLTSSAFLERQLDRIPLRRALERSRTFGGHKGSSIAIPFSVTLEYVLEQKLALAALGEGLLARLVAPGAASAAPIFALDVAPPVMSAEAWATILHVLAQQSLAGSPGPATRRVVEHLMRWRDAHLAVTAEPTELVFTASGNRR